MDTYVAPIADKLYRASSNLEILDHVKNYRFWTWTVRLVFTAVVLAWGSFLTDKYLNSKNQADYQQWNAVNLLWFGAQPEGLLVLIFKVWLLTLAVTVGLQVLQRFRAI